jgi:hypothetical protein
MTELKTSLPIEEVRALRTMCIATINLNPRECDHTEVTTSFSKSEMTVDGKLNPERDVPVDAILYKITDPVVVGYLPTKVFYDEAGGLQLMYYVSAALPDSVRPLGTDKPVYCFSFPLAFPSTYTYDASLRVFIDQITTPHGVRCIVMFGQDEYDQIIIDEKTFTKGKGN